MTGIRFPLMIGASKHSRVSIPKLRKVRFKANGCELTMLDTHAHREHVGCRASLREYAKIASNEIPAMSGWALVCWDSAGSSYRNVYNSAVSPLYRQQIPRYAADKLETHLHNVG